MRFLHADKCAYRIGQGSTGNCYKSAQVAATAALRQARLACFHFEELDNQRAQKKEKVS